MAGKAGEKQAHLAMPYKRQFSDPSSCQLDCVNMPKASSRPQDSMGLSKNVSALTNASMKPTKQLAQKNSETSKKMLFDSGANITIVSSLPHLDPNTTPSFYRAGKPSEMWKLPTLQR